MKHFYSQKIKGLAIALILCLVQVFSFAQNYVTVGNGTSATSSSSATPYSTVWEDGRHMYLYPSGQLANNGMVAGMIWSLGFDVASTSGVPLNGFTIKISTLPQGVNQIPTAWPTNSTTVFTSTSAVVPVVGWNQYIFQTPFFYNGTDGIIVEVCFDNNSWSSSASVRYSFMSNKVKGRYQDNAVGCNLSNGFSSSYRPNIRFDNSPLFTNDAGVNNLINPVFPTCAMDSNVKVSISNTGSANLVSANVNWSINGVLQVPIAWTGNLVQNSMDTVTLGIVAGGLNDGDTLSVWTSLPNGVSDSATFNDTITEYLYNSMAGNYTILPNGGGDFISFTDAISRMQDYGVCSDVIIQAADSTYQEHIMIGNIPGNSDSATITFTKLPGGGKPKIVYSASSTADNYVVQLKNASYITLDNLTMKSTGSAYCRVLTAGANTSHITVNKCYLEAGSSSNTSTNKANMYLDDATDASHWHITNNVFYRGSYGIKYWGGSSTNQDEGTIIANNKFTDQRYKTLDIYYQNNLQLTGNMVQSWINYANGTAIIVGYSNGCVIADNHVKGRSTWPKYGLQCLNLSGTYSNMVQVVNNRIHVPSGTSNVGINVSNNMFVNYAFNSVYKSAFNTNQNRGFYIKGNGHVELRNNNVQIRKSGTAIYVEGSSLAVCDYNNFSAPDSTCRVGYINGGYLDSLSHWQVASGMDSHSISIDSVYTDTINLLVCNPDLYGMGIAVPGITTDYNGNPRSTTPCIGAHEFMPITELGVGLDGVLCDGDTLSLSQYYFDTIVWNGSDTSNLVAITSPGTQSLAVIGLCGADTVNVIVQSQSYANIADVNLCEGDTLQLNAGVSNGQYQWSNGSTDSVLSVHSAQVLFVDVVDAYGCSSSDSAVITQSQDVNLPDSLSFCEGSSVTMDANMAGSYLWSTGATSQTEVANSEGHYSVQVTDQNCVSSDTIYVSEILDVIPSFEDSSSLFTVKFTNTTQNATSYHWDFGDGTSSTEEHPIHFYPWTIEDSITYNVVLTATNGSCHTATFSSENVRVGQLVSVSALNANPDVLIYPNPNHGYFTIELNNRDEVNVTIVDAKGLVVFTQKVSSVSGKQQLPVSLSAVASGIYYVKVNFEDSQSVHKIVVE